jgi:hypothetical protein
LDAEWLGGKADMTNSPMFANDQSGHLPAISGADRGVGINEIPTSIHEIVELLLERRDLDLCVFEIVLKPL